MPGPITGSDAAPADPTGRVWFAERQTNGYRLVVARLVDEALPQRTVTSVVTARGVAYRISRQQPTAGPQGVPTFTEHSVPSGTFPDQIWSDSTGLIWFSQPSNNAVTSFDAATKVFKQYPTTGGTGPDGLWVDDKDRVWTGLYYSGGLGVLDVPTKVFTAHAAPYSPHALAIPSPSADGGVWVTDHANNRISEWDPVGKKWLQSLPMPIANTWVVQGCLDPGRGVVYFTGYSSQTLPMKTRTGPITDIPVPSRGGPAFLAFHDDKVWFSLWSSNRLGEYDVVSKVITEYAYTAGETGGPMSIGPDGRPVVGTKNAGYIEVFDPVSKTFGHYKIPSSTGLKDGLCVAPDGAIWFTGSYTNKIARLEVQ
jgi:streptogramin lyase